MSVQDETSRDSLQADSSPIVPETKTRPKGSRRKKPRHRSRTRIRDDVETGSNDPDYSPYEEIDEASVSTCSTPVPDKFSSNDSTPVPTPQVYPNTGTICGLCYYGEKSLLGQGELTRYDPTPNFNPFRRPSLKTRGSRDSLSGHSPASESGDRTGKSPSRSRSRETRHSRDSTSRSSELRTFDVVEELSTVGIGEVVEPTQVFESTGHVTAHHCCAAWSEGVTQNELYQLLCVDKAVHWGMSQKCSYCQRFGATIKCKALRCDRLFHYPCAAGSGCFQDIKAMLLLCPDHLEQAPSIASPEELNCALCDDIGEISDFLFCTSCGHHYHGGCLRVDVNPMVRVGWQCPECKICQTCRQPGDDNQMLVCDSCDKGYHTYCLQPAMSFIPKNGWCCQACRRCIDCDLKAPGNGVNSIWHCNDQVCDSCFQLRGKGSSCPVCKKAYPAGAHKDDMLHCNECKRWVHDECEDVIDMDTYFDMGTDYSCPRCRDEAEDVPPQSEDLVQNDETIVFSSPSTSQLPGKSGPSGILLEDVSQKDAAKRSNISASMESDQSSTGMKGSSTDPMLFSAGNQLGDLKKRNISGDISLHHPRLGSQDRKSSSDSHIGNIFPDADTQDPLSGLFSGDAYQPIVSVPMLFEDSQGNVLTKELPEWPKRKARRLSSDSSPPTKPQPKPTLSPTDSPPNSHGKGMGKPGTMFGKGKPFTARRRPGVRGARGKGYSRGKGRGSRRPRGGLSASAGTPALNIPSPTGPMTSPGQPSPSPSVSARRRSRSRWRSSVSGAESVLGAIVAADVGPESADEEYGDSMHNTVVLCSADDDFTLNQDMCVVCGSFGQGAEGRLVACSQCGQCYHPYCVNLKLTKVVLRKGWRCLDCTVCEECGAADNPSHLLLCDDCDISYHTYCLKPPLQHVPKGGWKCKWCVRCTHCGSTSPGTNCDWQENYTSCGLCASLAHCPFCRKSYRDEEIIIQCSHCERWLHASCECLFSESDIEKVLEKGYTCILCRPKGTTPPHLDLNPHSMDGDPSTGIYPGRTRSDAEAVKEYHKDGVALTSIGLQHIQQLMQKAMGQNKKKPPISRRRSQAQRNSDKTSGISSTKSSPSGLDTSLDGIKGEADVLSTSGDPGQQTPTKSEADPTAEQYGLPGGLEVDSTTGEVIFPGEVKPAALKEKAEVKRRRKPYRPGIGGFNVRQRGRGSYIGSSRGRARFRRGGVTISSGRMIGGVGFEQGDPKSTDVKMRASEIQGESGSNYIKHESEGGITIAHENKTAISEVPVPQIEGKVDGQSGVVPPLKLKISNVAQPGHKKRKKRTRIIDTFPPYIQEGFFGNDILSIARTTSAKALESFEMENRESKHATKTSDSSRIVLPERIKLRLEAQVAQKAAEARKKADLKHDRLQARRLPSGDDEGLVMDKESEELLSVLPEDLQFKDDELLGIISGSLKAATHGEPDSHVNILSPNVLESLVKDGLASMDGDVTSLFSEVLNPSHDVTNTGDDHGLLGDIGNLNESTKTANNSSLNTSSLQDTSMPSNAAAVSAANSFLDQTTAIISSMETEQSQSTATDNNTTMVKQEPVQMLPTPKQPQIMQQQQQQQQQQINHQQQMMLNQPMLQRQQSMPVMPSQMTMMAGGTGGSGSGQMPAGMSMAPRHMMHGQMHGQQGHVKMGIMQGQQPFISGMPPGGEKLMEGPMGSPSPGMVMRQQSMDVPSANQFNFQGHPPQSLTPSSGGMQMFRASQQQGLSQPGSVVHSPVPQSPAVSQMVESSPAKLPGQPHMMAVSSLPDLTSDSDIFEPAPPPWPLGTNLEGDTLSVNQRNILKWEKDEPLGELATISPVLYANLKHSYLKSEFPDWQQRAKQVAKLWRKATSDERAPYLQKARDNRAYLKTTRRDLDHLTDQELLSTELPDNEEDQKQIAAIVAGELDPQQTQGQGKLPSNPGVQNQQNFQMTKPMTGSSPGPSVSSDGNFVKPRPLSRDPTPKPVSPGAASAPPSVRGRSTFIQNMPLGSPVSGAPRNRAPWNDPMFVKQQELQQQQFQGQAMQMKQLQQGQMVMNQGQNPMQFQQQIPGPGLRIPKMETSDTMVMGLNQGPQFPQQHPSMTPTPPLNSPIRPGTPIQRQDCGQDEHLNQQQEFGRMPQRPINAPQLLSQPIGAPIHVHQRPMTPVSPHPGGMRMPTPQGMGSQPPTPQPMVTMRDPFQDIAIDKPKQKRTSVTENQVTLQQPPNTTEQGVTGVRMPSAEVKSEITDQKPVNVSSAPLNIMQGTVVRPPIRETLHHHALRRYKLLEQQAIPSGPWAIQTSTAVTRPPPPYPTQASTSQAISSSAFNHPRISTATGSSMVMSAPRVRGFAPGAPPPQSPTFQPVLRSPLGGPNQPMGPSFGMEHYPSVRMPAPTSSDGSSQNVPASPVSGGYIELKHSRQPDPAVRREQIIRAGNLPVTTAETQQPTVTLTAPPIASSTAEALVVPKKEKITLNESSAMPTSASDVVPTSSSIEVSVKIKTEPESESKADDGIKDKTSDKKADTKSMSDDKAKPKVTTDEATNVSTNAKGDAAVGSTTEAMDKEVSEIDKNTVDKPEQSTNTGNEPKTQTPSSETIDAQKSGVNIEHSYVKVGIPDVAETKLQAKNAEIESIRRDEELMRTPDGQIHGVGLTPPPDAELAGIASMQEDDPQVSNVVTVEREDLTKEKVLLDEKMETSEERKKSEEKMKEVTQSKNVSSKGEPTESAETKDKKDEGDAKEETLSKDETAAKDVNDEKESVDSKEASSKTEEQSETSKNVESVVSLSDLPMKQETQHEENDKVVEAEQSKPTESQEDNIDLLTSVDIPSPQMPILEQCPQLNTTESIPFSLSSDILDKTLTLPDISSEATKPCDSPTKATSQIQTPSAPIDPTVNVSTTTTLTSPVVSAIAVSTVVLPSGSSVMTSVSNEGINSSSVGMVSASPVVSTLAASVGQQAFESSATGINVTNTGIAAHTKPQTMTSVPSQGKPGSLPLSYHGVQGSQGISQAPQPPKQKPLLIKEQPLLIQDLLDEEKKEQERARREKMTQAMLQQQQQQQQQGGIFPVIENEEGIAPDVGIDQILQAKIKILSGINRVINSGSTTQAVTEVTVQAGPFVQQPQQPGNPHWQQNVQGQPAQQTSMMGAPSFGTDADSQQKKARYEEWLYQHQALLQMQVKELEQKVKQHRLTKQALTKKQRQSKKSGEEFTPQDSMNLNNVNKQQLETQHQLDEIKKRQIRHTELMQDYNIKKGTMQYPGMPTVPQQQQPQRGMVHIFQPPPPHLQQQQQQQQQQPSQQQMTMTSQPAQTPAIMRQQSAPGSMNVGMQQPPPSRSAALTPGPGIGNPPIAQFTSPGPMVPSSGVVQQPNLQSQEFISQLQKMPAFRQMNPSQIQLAMQQGGIIITSSSSMLPSNQGQISLPGTQGTQMRPQMVHQGPDPIRGKFSQAQVSSVNINMGSNMTPTQGALVRQMGHEGHQGPPFMQMQHGVHPQTHVAQTKEEKPKRKRKKKKTPSEDAGPVMPPGGGQISMSPHMVSPMGSPRFSAPPGMMMPAQSPGLQGPMQFTGQFPQASYMQNMNQQRLPSGFPASSMHQKPGVGVIGNHGQVMSSAPPGMQSALPHSNPMLVQGQVFASHGQVMQPGMIQSYPSLKQAPTSAVFSSPSNQHTHPHMSASMGSDSNIKMPTTGFSPTTVKCEDDPMMSSPPFSMSAALHNAPKLMQSGIRPSMVKKETKYSRQLSSMSESAFHRSSTPHTLTDKEMDIVMANDPDASDASSTNSDKLGSMDPKIMESVDETISGVIRDGIEYGKKLEIARSTGEVVQPPSWLHSTKFPKYLQHHMMPAGRGQTITSFGGLGSDRLGNHQELLRHMLQQGMPGHGPITDQTDLSMMPDHFKKQLELMGHPFFMKHAEEGLLKKKRSRKTSKDKEGKAGGAKRRKKGKKGGEDGSGVGDDEMRHMMKDHPQYDLSPESAIIKSVSQLKPLPLPPLVEPEIKLNFNMCMPKGTGLPLSKSLLEGTIGNATYKGLPDYYDLILSKDPLSYLNPPTPPSSLPPSPKRERLNSLEELKSDPYILQQAVKIPDSLPTPPHHGPESMEDLTPITGMTDDAVQASSPEPDDDQLFAYDKLTLMRMAQAKDDLSRFQIASTNTQQMYRPLSPSLPELNYPTYDTMDEKDQVSVTLSFKNSSSKAVKKSLSLLSRALGTSIISFKLLNGSGTDGSSMKESPRSDGQKAITDSQSRDASGGMDILQPNQRRCCSCSRPVQGNGVRRPQFDENALEEDIIFCNKQCYFTYAFTKKPNETPPPTKKKWKASHIYQRHTTKINISSLIEANPDPDHLSARGQRMYNLGCSFDGRVDEVSLRSGDGKGRGRGRRRGSTGPGEDTRITTKRWKGIKWKRWTVTVTVVKATNQKPPPDVDALLNKYGSALKPPQDTRDTRVCVLCGTSGDGITTGVARLLNLDVDQWVHLNCALWSAEVYETQGGALINVDLAVRHGASAICGFCQKKGATISCNRTRCTNIYHCACALECECLFFKDKTVLCPVHGASYSASPSTGASDQLRSLAVFRKVYVQRQETKQIASIMQQGELTQGEKNYILRVGALMFHAVGQLSTHQMSHFHSKTAIYPVGYKATRIYWSSNNTRKRCKYMCMITEKESKPQFTTRYQAVASRSKTETSIQGQWVELAGDNVNEQWLELLQQLVNLRSQHKMLKLFPAYINGENIFGLTSPVVCRILESLPNIELCASYKFRFGRSPLLELPLAINPTGCARTEPHIKQSRKKPHTLISNLISEYYESTGIGDASSSLYGKHFVHSKSSQYRRMKQEWRNNVYLARSRIQGLGLFAARDIEPGTMVIEYIGDIIRSEVAEKREKQYEAANRGVYMFRLDSDYIVDATVSGGPARYINHSCNPNCVAEVVNFEKEKKIMIISNRHILRGEELNYDYKFDFEDEGNKIPCLCGAINCRKWMN